MKDDNRRQTQAGEIGEIDIAAKQSVSEPITNANPTALTSNRSRHAITNKSFCCAIDCEPKKLLRGRLTER